MIPIDYLRECFTADFAGGDLRWSESRPAHHFTNAGYGSVFKRRHAGKVAGCVGAIGYRVVNITYLGKARKVLAHRILWALKHGAWPAQVIDHINHIRDDNRDLNIRDVSPAANACNKKATGGVRKGIALGVRKRGNSFIAYVGGGQKGQRYLGSFADLRSAVDVANAARGIA